MVQSSSGAGVQGTPATDVMSSLAAAVVGLHAFVADGVAVWQNGGGTGQSVGACRLMLPQFAWVTLRQLLATVLPHVKASPPELLFTKMPPLLTTPPPKKFC